MLRFVLILLLIVFIARAFWRVVDGLLEGLSGSRGRGVRPPRGGQMVRDPVCGTFILPDQAIALVDGSRRVFFCSTLCRDKYRARPA
jgi:YHS domain-containing protein